MGGLDVGDIDGDGHTEFVIGGKAALLWYRPDTLEKGVISYGIYVVGLVVADIDGDGKLEVLTDEEEYPETGLRRIVWFKPGASLDDPWTRHIVGQGNKGNAHDLVYVDIDNDGEKEIVAIGVPNGKQELKIYKRTADVTQLWTKYTIDDRHFAEGTGWPM